MLKWWADDPANPDRLSLNDPDVQHLIAAISPESHVTDLGGVMSLNVRLGAAGASTARAPAVRLAAAAARCSERAPLSRQPRIAGSHTGVLEQHNDVSVQEPVG
jgi:hypothetical protein